MERLRREMNRLFSGLASGAEAGVTSGYPAMNVWANEDGAIVTAELPGVAPEEMDISVVDDTLTVSGSREPVELEEGEVYHRRERGSGKFTRSFRLPFQIAASEVEAVFKKGVLQISLPRSEEDKPKKISVKSS
jgi:HSP20 family protein